MHFQALRYFTSSVLRFDSDGLIICDTLGCCKPFRTRASWMLSFVYYFMFIMFTAPILFIHVFIKDISSEYVCVCLCVWMHSLELLVRVWRDTIVITAKCNSARLLAICCVWANRMNWTNDRIKERELTFKKFHMHTHKAHWHMAANLKMSNWTNKLLALALSSRVPCAYHNVLHDQKHPPDSISTKLRWIEMCFFLPSYFFAVSKLKIIHLCGMFRINCNWALHYFRSL